MGARARMVRCVGLWMLPVGIVEAFAREHRAMTHRERFPSPMAVELFQPRAAPDVRTAASLAKGVFGPGIDRSHENLDRGVGRRPLRSSLVQERPHARPTMGGWRERR